MKSRILLSLLAIGVGVLIGYAAATGKLFSLQAPQPSPVGKRDRAVLPVPDAPFQGVAKRTLAGSKPDFPRDDAAQRCAQRAARPG